jgi:hypothetical protein
VSHLTDARWWARRFKVTPTEMMSVAHRAIADYCYEKGLPIDNKLANREAASATRWMLDS